MQYWKKAPSTLNLLVKCRTIELKNFAIAKTGLIDPQLVTYMAFINPNKTNLNPANMRELLETIRSSNDSEIIEKTKNIVLNYIKAEYDENWTVIKNILGENYDFPENSNE